MFLNVYKKRKAIPNKSRGYRVPARGGGEGGGEREDRGSSVAKSYSVKRLFCSFLLHSADGHSLC